MAMSAQPSFALPAASPVGPTVLHELSDLAGWVRAARDAITGLRARLDDESVPVRGGDVQAIERLARRVDAARLAALARVDAARISDEQGETGTESWYARAARRDSASAASDTALARRLTQDEDLASTREAIHEGALSTEHAKVIAHAMSHLPDGLTPQERARVERHLVEQARLLDPTRLRRAARRALAALDRPPDRSRTTTARPCRPKKTTPGPGRG